MAALSRQLSTNLRPPNNFARLTIWNVSVGGPCIYLLERPPVPELLHVHNFDIFSLADFRHYGLHLPAVENLRAPRSAPFYLFIGCVPADFSLSFFAANYFFRGSIAIY
jgi:hypothetical protein